MTRRLLLSIFRFAIISSVYISHVSSYLSSAESPTLDSDDFNSISILNPDLDSDSYLVAPQKLNELSKQLQSILQIEGVHKEKNSLEDFVGILPPKYMIDLYHKYDQFEGDDEKESTIRCVLGKVRRDSIHFNLSSLVDTQSINHAEVHVFRRASRRRGGGKSSSSPRSKYSFAQHRIRLRNLPKKNFLSTIISLQPSRGWQAVDITSTVKTSVGKGKFLSMTVEASLPEFGTGKPRYHTIPIDEVLRVAYKPFLVIFSQDKSKVLSLSSEDSSTATRKVKATSRSTTTTTRTTTTTTPSTTTSTTIAPYFTYSRTSEPSQPPQNQNQPKDKDNDFYPPSYKTTNYEDSKINSHDDDDDEDDSDMDELENSLKSILNIDKATSFGKDYSNSNQILNNGNNDFKNHHHNNFNNRLYYSTMDNNMNNNNEDRDGDETNNEHDFDLENNEISQDPHFHPLPRSSSRPVRRARTIGSGINHDQKSKSKSNFKSDSPIHSMNRRSIDDDEFSQDPEISQFPQHSSFGGDSETKKKKNRKPSSPSHPTSQLLQLPSSFDYYLNENLNTLHDDDDDIRQYHQRHDHDHDSADTNNHNHNRVEDNQGLDDGLSPPSLSSFPSSSSVKQSSSSKESSNPNPILPFPSRHRWWNQPSSSPSSWSSSKGRGNNRRKGKTNGGRRKKLRRNRQGKKYWLNERTSSSSSFSSLSFSTISSSSSPPPPPTSTLPPFAPPAKSKAQLFHEMEDLDLDLDLDESERENSDSRTTTKTTIVTTLANKKASQPSSSSSSSFASSSSSSSLSCRLEKLSVDIAHIDWAGAIIAPAVLPLHYCEGTCSQPTITNSQVDLTDYLADEVQPTPKTRCCSPLTKKRLVVLYADVYDNIVLRIQPNVTTTSCQCL